MAKAVITILCPSGHRRKANMTPNSNLLQVLEDMCHQENLDSSEWGITHQRKKCDLTIPWRLAGIPTNALLEMYKLEERRPMSDVTIQLQLSDNSRHAGSFQPSITLREMLEQYRCQPNSLVAVFDNSINNDGQLHPVCSYMSEEIIGDYALSNTTIRELGLTSGAAVIRYNHRAMNEEDLKKINSRIDEKIARRHRQSQPQTTESTPAPPPSAQAATTISVPQYPVVDTSVTSLRNDEYSIFRDIPASRPVPTTTQQQQPRTLAEALGINISLDQPSVFEQHQSLQSQPNFSNFKFPEATKGQNLFQNELSDNNPRSQSSKSCDRHAMAYDLTKIPSTPINRTEDLPDSFFELTPDDLRSVLNSLRQQSEEENALETRSMRERAQSARANSYQHIAIRLVVNSSLVLQGLFYPQETVASLLEFVQANLICPQLNQAEFYLYTSPPRVVLSNLTKSLSSYDLIPAAYVYLGHRKVSPLSVELASNVPIGTIDEANQLVAQYVFNRSQALGVEDANATNRPVKRNTPMNNMDDKQIRDKLSKFLPGKK
ncbi:unnamed protein product [Adineta ricciae]|uniref:UBX domain-containing protein n=1 Tax=Adineta ricciae TaxID=249248 RepID=A0A816AVH0_ADIRI|nr:unnamed protein product [Adineta ricciae]CAF1600580.1 unnamed protein product [Adineta ricciae]